MMYQFKDGPNRTRSTAFHPDAGLKVQLSDCWWKICIIRTSIRKHLWQAPLVWPHFIYYCIVLYWTSQLAKFMCRFTGKVCQAMPTDRKMPDVKSSTNSLFSICPVPGAARQAAMMFKMVSAVYILQSFLSFLVDISWEHKYCVSWNGNEIHKQGTRHAKANHNSSHDHTATIILFAFIRGVRELHKRLHSHS